MSRFYDRIMERGLLATGHKVRGQVSLSGGEVSGALYSWLEDAQVIAIDDVVAYVSSLDKAAWQVDDFPAVPPPFQTFFTEFSGPPLPEWMTAAGILWKGIGPISKLDPEDVQFARNLLQKPLDEIEWVMIGTVLAEYHWAGQGDQIVAIGSVKVWADGDGRCLGRSTGSLIDPGEDTDQEAVEGFESATILVTIPSLLAISFMHCRNVDLLPTEPPERLNRARVKRGKKALARYYTLNIQPMKEILHDEGQVEKTGLKRALHVCRGHFAHYGEAYGRGRLFGKLEGRFWMPATVKGNLKEGLVVKDYNVKTSR